MNLFRPTVFIGSSSEGRAYANAVFSELEAGTEPSVWDQSLFAPTRGTLEELERLSREFDFAILVLTPDDQRQSRGQDAKVPRDNLIAELGLFIGALGRDRVFFLTPQDEKLVLPTDFLGVTSLRYSSRRDQNYRAAVRTACIQIMEIISKNTPISMRTLPSSKFDFVIPASIEPHRNPTEVILWLPDRTKMVRISRRPLVSEVGLAAPLRVTITPFVPTSEPVENRIFVGDRVEIEHKYLKGETVFLFENHVISSQIEIPQTYRYFAQVVTIEAFTD